MKEEIIKPNALSEQNLVEFSKSNQIHKSLYVKVPSGYKGIAYIDDAATFRLEPSGKVLIYKEYGKEYLGKELKLAFVKIKTLPQMSWGFGNIQVNNERLREAYRAGTNGKFIIELVDYVKFINSFTFGKPITIDEVKEKTLSIIKTIGIPIVSSCFSNTNISVFEISSMVGDIREKIFNDLEKESIFKNLGIKISTITVDGIHVNEEDLQMIRDNINN